MQIKNLSKADYYKSRNIVVPKIQHKLPKQPSPPFNLNLNMPAMAQEIQRYLTRRILMEKNEITRMAMEPTYHKLGIDVQDLKKVIANRQDQITTLKSEREKDFRKIESLQSEVFDLHEQLNKVDFQYKNYIEMIISSNKVQLKLHTDKITLLQEENRKITEDYNNLIQTTKEKYQLKSNSQSNSSLECYNQDLFEQYRKEIEDLNIEKQMFRQKAIINEIDAEKKTKFLENELFIIKNQLEKMENDLHMEILKNDTVITEKNMEILNLVGEIDELNRQTNNEKQSLVNEIKQSERLKEQSQKQYKETIEKDRQLIQQYIKTISSLDSQIIQLKGIIDQRERQIQQMKSKVTSLEFEKQENEMSREIEIDRMSQSQNASIQEEVLIAKRTYEVTISKIELELKEAKSFNLIKNDEIKKLSEEVSKKESLLKGYRDADRDRDCELDLMKRKNEKLSQQCNSLMNEIQNLQRDHQKEKKEIESRVNHEKMNQTNKIQKGSSQSNEIIIQLKQQIQEGQKLHQSEINTLNKQIAGKKKEIQSLKKEKQCLKQEKQNIETKYKVLQMDHQNYKIHYEESICKYKKSDKQKNTIIESHYEDQKRFKKEINDLRQRLQKEQVQLHELKRLVSEEAHKPRTQQCYECVKKQSEFKVLSKDFKVFKKQTINKVKETINLQDTLQQKAHTHINEGWVSVWAEITPLMEGYEKEIKLKDETIMKLQKNCTVLTEKNKQLNQAILTVKNLHEKNVQKNRDRTAEKKKNYRYAEINLDESNIQKQKKKLQTPKPASNSVQKTNYRYGKINMGELNLQQQRKKMETLKPALNQDENSVLKSIPKSAEKNSVTNSKNPFIRIQEASSIQSSEGMSQCASEYANSDQLNNLTYRRKTDENYSVKQSSLAVSQSLESEIIKAEAHRLQENQQDKVQSEIYKKIEEKCQLAQSILDQISLVFSEYQKSGLYQKPILYQISPEKVQQEEQPSYVVVSSSEASEMVIQKDPSERKSPRTKITNIENVFNFMNTDNLIQQIKLKTEEYLENAHKKEEQVPTVETEKKLNKNLILELKKQRERIQKLEKQSQQTIEDCKKINNKLEKCLKVLDPQNSRKGVQEMEILKNQVERIIKVTDNLQEKLKKQNSKKQSLRKNIEEAKKNVEDHLDTIQKMSLAMKNCQSEKCKIQEKLSEEIQKLKQKYERELSKKKTSFLSLQNQVDEKTTEISNLKFKLLETETKLRNEDQGFIQKLHIKDEQIQELNRKIENLNIEYSELEQKYLQTESKLKDTQIRIITSNEQMLKMRKQLKEDTDKFAKETQTLKFKLAEQLLKNKENDSYKKQVQILKQAMKKLEENNDNLNKKLDERQISHEQNLKEKDKRWQDHIERLKSQHEKSMNELKIEKNALHQKFEKKCLEHELEIKNHIEKYEKYVTQKLVERSKLQKIIESKEKELSELLESSKKDQKTIELLVKFRMRWEKFCQDFELQREVIPQHDVKYLDESCIMFKSKLDQTQNQVTEANIPNSNMSRSKIFGKDINEISEIKEFKLETQKKEKIYFSEKNEMERTVRHEIKKKNYEEQKDQHQVEFSYIKEEDSESLESGTEAIKEFYASQEQSTEFGKEKQEEKPF